MEILIKDVAVFSNAFGATGDLIPEVLLGSKNSSKQGMVKVGNVDQFTFSGVEEFSGRIPYMAAVKGIYTFDPNVAATISDFQFKFEWNGYHPKYPNAERQHGSVIISPNPGETFDNEQLVDRCVAAINGQKGNILFTASKSGAGAAAVLLITEDFFTKPYSRYTPFFSCKMTGLQAGMTFTKTTATVVQQSMLGQDILDMQADPGNRINFVLSGAISPAGLYSGYEIIISEKNLARPFNLSENKPYRVLVFALESAANFAAFNTKLNALFNVDSTAFVPYTYGLAASFTDAGDLVTPTVPANTPKNGEEVIFETIVTTTGIAINTVYYVVNRTATTFQVAATRGGAPIALTTNGTGTFAKPWIGDATADTVIAIPGRV